MLCALLQQLPSNYLAILDLGCGPGRFTIPLAQLQCGKTLLVYALDKAHAMLVPLAAHVEEYKISNITIQLGDFME